MPQVTERIPPLVFPLAPVHNEACIAKLRHQELFNYLRTNTHNYLRTTRYNFVTKFEENL